MFWAGASEPQPEAATGPMIPPLSPLALAGQNSFNAQCAACHGENGFGSPQGPPLIHVIYEPSHHGDFAFVRAVQQGVRAHHWRFGNMPAQPQVSPNEIASIIAFIREVQVAHGIR
ncbi:c-type cytochrome [Rubricella aquisinus]|nr:cytochrome c [Rubricella aquisinus]